MGHPFKDTFTFDEALHYSEGPSAFNLMIKPAGSLCNLDCHYCYYLDKAEIYHGRQPRMSEDMLETLTKQYIESNDVPEVTFNWHGGEPLVMGLDFYRKAVELQRRFASGKIIHNTLQTNGTLVTPEWADFFRANDFLIGISIDGPADIHDKFRKDKGGQPTFNKVMHAVSLLRQRGVQFNTMTTVNKASEGRGAEVYRFLKSIGSRYMQFMPVVEHVMYPVDSQGRVQKNARPYIVAPETPGAYLARWSVSSQGFGKFMCDIFDEWWKGDVGRYFVNLFDATLAGYCGVQPGSCSYAATCGDNLVVEHNGDVYPCDHFVYPEYFSGNIETVHLRQIATSDRQRRFGLNKRNALPSKCIACRYGHLCHGECPKHRFSKTDSGDTGLSALCSGYYMFFEHTSSRMLQMRDAILKSHREASI